MKEEIMCWLVRDAGEAVYNQDFLNKQPAVEETKFLRHVRFEKPVVVKMDGKKKLGVVLMPKGDSD